MEVWGRWIGQENIERCILWRRKCIFLVALLSHRSHELILHIVWDETCLLCNHIDNMGSIVLHEMILYAFSLHRWLSTLSWTATVLSIFFLILLRFTFISRKWTSQDCWYHFNFYWVTDCCIILANIFIFTITKW